LVGRGIGVVLASLLNLLLRGEVGTLGGVGDLDRACVRVLLALLDRGLLLFHILLLRLHGLVSRISLLARGGNFLG